MPAHTHYMQIALSYAKRHVGMTGSNPSVGCVIVKDDRIVAASVTAKGGRPHAETQALAQAGAMAKGATVYVTLEPCSHTGQTPPCAQALIDAGIAHVVIATVDTYHKVQGAGIDRLKEAGLQVLVGVCEEDARQVNAGFFSVQEKKRPFVTLKIASTLDGCIATHTGSSQWITGQRARDYAHLLRARHDAILVGWKTVCEDAPQLNCRLKGLEDASPIPIILDMNNRLLEDSDASSQQAIALLKNPNLLHITAPTPLPSLLSDLARKHGITRLLIEGGAATYASFIKEGLVDEIIWIGAPSLIGGDGLPAVGALGVDHVDNRIQLSIKERFMLGQDEVRRYGFLE